MILCRRPRQANNAAVWLFFAAFSALLTPGAWADFETEIAAEGGKWANYYEQEDLEGEEYTDIEDS